MKDLKRKIEAVKRIISDLSNAQSQLGREYHRGDPFMKAIERLLNTSFKELQDLERAKRDEDRRKKEEALKRR